MLSAQFRVVYKRTNLGDFMKKLIATFLFAAGVGVSFTAAATNCYYYCNLAKNHCLAQAGTNADAQQACWDEFTACTDGC